MRDNVALSGVRIAVTRAGDRGNPMAVALRSAGATVHEIPLTRVEALPDAPLRAALEGLMQYGWVVLTSTNAVDRLAASLTPTQRAQLETRRIAAVGPTTADAISALGWRVALVPEKSQAEALVDAMASRTDVEGARVLYPAAEGARDVLPAGLRALGATVDVVPVYRTAPDWEGQSTLRKLVAASELDLVVVAAPSAVDALLEALPAEHARRLPVACIGPVTARAARVAGFPVRVESGAATSEGLARAIIAALGTGGTSARGTGRLGDR